MSLKNYTPEQAERLKDAVYKVADAYQIFKELAGDMQKECKWRTCGDMERAASVINENLIGKEGCLNSFLKVL